MNYIENGEENKKLPVFFWVIVAVAVLLLVTFIFKAGFNFWFFALLLAWVWFIFFTKKTISLGTFILQKFAFIFIGFVILTFIFMRFDGVDNKSMSDNSNNQDGSNGSDYIQEESYSGTLGASFSMGQELDRVNGKQTRALNYSVTAMVRLYPLENIVGAKYKNIKLKNMPKGEVTLSLPTGGYSEKFMNDGSDVIEIPVMKTKEEALYANQIFGDNAYVTLGIDVANAFQFDVSKAYEGSDHGLWASDGIRAAEISPSELDNALEFDIELELESGKKITKHFTGAVLGEGLLEGGENAGRLKDVKLDVK